jgi:hypothetical protein
MLPKPFIIVDGALDLRCLAPRCVCFSLSLCIYMYMYQLHSSPESVCVAVCSFVSMQVC